jgi:hypothetical protein
MRFKIANYIFAIGANVSKVDTSTTLLQQQQSIELFEKTPARLMDGA